MKISKNPFVLPRKLLRADSSFSKQTVLSHSRMESLPDFLEHQRWIAVSGNQSLYPHVSVRFSRLIKMAIPQSRAVRETVLGYISVSTLTVLFFLLSRYNFVGKNTCECTNGIPILTTKAPNNPQTRPWSKTCLGWCGDKTIQGCSSFWSMILAVY